MTASDDVDRTRDRYRAFGESEARGRSPLYEEWALGVAGDEELLGLLRPLPAPKQQPNLLFGAARLVGSPQGPYGAWRRWVLEHWIEVEREIRARWTQTNEVLRCAALLPALERIPGPIALLEAGASAGLCLLLDRYSYRWRAGGGIVALDPASGPSAVVLDCTVTGEVPLPARMPDIVWRAGLDRAAIDVTDDDATGWLETLVWPEEQERRERLARALELARHDPPRVVEGDAVDALPALAAEAPTDATLVVLSSAAIVYLPPDARARFLDAVPALGARLLSLEGRGIVPGAAAALDALRPRPARSEFVLALDDTPLALVDPHGRSIDAEGIPWPA